MWICQPNNPSSWIPWEVPLWRMCLGIVVPIINHHPMGPQEHENVIDIRDQRPQSPQFPSSSLDHGFESNWSSFWMASLMLSRSYRSDRSWHPRRVDKPPHLQEWGCQRCSNLPELEVGFNSILMCRVQGSHPPTLCNKILARLSQRVGMQLHYGYNLGQCIDNLVWTL